MQIDRGSFEEQAVDRSRLHHGGGSGSANITPHLLLHLALHGRGDARHGQRGSLLFSDGAGATEWIDSLRRFWKAANVSLVAPSGCSTAVTGPAHGYELVSLAHNVIEAGTSAFIDCLCRSRLRRVDFNNAFYENFGSSC